MTISRWQLLLRIAAAAFIITFTVPVSDGGDHTVNISDGSTTRRYTLRGNRTASSPDSPIPTNNSITSAYTVFKWQAVTDPSLPVTYNLEISSDQNFLDLVLQKQGLSETQIHTDRNRSRGPEYCEDGIFLESHGC